jgi:hypothetical protein
MIFRRPRLVISDKAGVPQAALVKTLRSADKNFWIERRNTLVSRNKLGQAFIDAVCADSRYLGPCTQA